MPKPLTDACAAVLPIVFVAMAFSILSTTRKLLVAGQSAFGAVKFSGAAKARRRRSPRG